MKELEGFKKKKNEDILKSMIVYMTPDEDDMEDEYEVGYTQKILIYVGKY